MNRIVVLVGGSLVMAVSLGAQGGARGAGQGGAFSSAACVGPGAAFGVIAYQCASCGFRQDSGRTIYSFNAEPVITEVTATSMLRAGDVIEAVRGHPITTAEGAAAFAYPGGRMMSWAGDSTVGRYFVADSAVVRLRGRVGVDSSGGGRGGWAVRPDSLRVAAGVLVGAGGRGGGGGARGGGDSARLRVARIGVDTLRARAARLYVFIESARFLDLRVRRDGNSMSLRVPATANCGGGGALGKRGRGSAPGSSTSPPPDSLIAEVPASLPAIAQAGRFGFAMTCAPSCSRTRAADGTVYLKYDGPPTIAAIRDGSPAERIGLRVGDVVTKVDGASILQAKGALSLFAAERARSLHLTVVRDGKEVGYLLQAR